MAAFQPSDDVTHDLGTTTKRWENLYVNNIIASGTTTGITATASNQLNVYTTPGTNYIVDESGETDQIILHAGNAEGTGSVILPNATDNIGRIIRIINTRTDFTSINIKTYNSDQNLIVFGSETVNPNTNGYQLGGSNVVTLICASATHWYAA